MTINRTRKQSEGMLNIQRSANYKPNIWKDDFLQSLCSKYDKEEFAMKLSELVIEIRGCFVQESEVLKKLELVDWIQKLGLTNHFKMEINEFLDTISISLKNNKNPSMQENVHVSALCFRLLRQHGYEVFPDNFLVEKMGDSLFVDDTKQIIELLEASHLGLNGENILDEVNNFAKSWLKYTLSISSSSINVKELSNMVVQKVVHALELPSHWRVPWFDVEWHIKQYQNEKHVDPILLELAKLNFNITQAKLQNEVKELSRWWEKLGIKKHLNFARSRLVESFMCATGVAFEPKFNFLRKWLTKVIIFVLVFDDIYDIHASFEELGPFTMAFHRWDAKELEELPEYMRICFSALQDVTNEIAHEIEGKNNFEMVLPYLKKAWKDFSKALYMEAKWYKMGYIPSLEEYLSNAWITSSGPVILLHSYFASMHKLKDETKEFLQTYEDVVYNVSLVIRLCNDLATTEAEKERGDAASSILCYMNEMNVSEDDARRHIQDIINSAWKRINEHYCSPRIASVKPFISQAINAARVAHTLYLNGDGFSIQHRDIKRHILSLLVEPL